MAVTKDTAKTSKATRSSDATPAKKRTSGNLTDDDEMPNAKAKCKCSSLASISYPRDRSLPCIIKVDDLHPMGLGDEGPEPIEMYLNISSSAFSQSPRITLEFVDKDYHPVPEIPCAYVNWGVDDYTHGKWLTTDLVIQSVARCPSNEGINDPAVVDRFRESDGRMPQGIMCMTIDVDHCQSTKT